MESISYYHVERSNGEDLAPESFLDAVQLLEKATPGCYFHRRSGLLKSGPEFHERLYVGSEGFARFLVTALRVENEYDIDLVSETPETAEALKVRIEKETGLVLKV